MECWIKAGFEENQRIRRIWEVGHVFQRRSKNFIKDVVIRIGFCRGDERVHVNI